MKQLIETLDFELEPFFNLSIDNLCIADFEGYFKKVNPAFAKLLGYTEEELYSKPVFDFIYEEDIDATIKHGENLVHGIPLLNFENRYVCKNGKLVWMHWTATRSEDEKFVYAIGKDVTFKKDLENERISHVTDLSRINDRLMQLNHITSHDLKSPVNNLVFLVDMLDTSKIKDETVLTVLEHIKRSANGLKTSLNAYIDAVAEDEVLEQELELVCFDEVFQHVKESIDTLASHAKVQFEVDFTEAQWVLFERSYMKSIFLNLISNSIKYAKPGVVPVISITTQIKDGHKKLIYKDNGLGFDMKKVGAQIFDLNNNRSDSRDNKGLGLYLVKKNVTSLGGSISVDSIENQGSTFTIMFGDLI
ncbi:PAS domain-containing sensor histidine kinase [Zobellia roscoffensis]|uniref:PAS domain-containing sensor histidine kinase n=1 Tax=Zobellia roscoffensis TaxID=2779508 RepID=UPI00188A4224|nr:PAS domain-containing sensor histidine kinase [Zobellia roscoffensis]